jgi:hypothetical protein
MSPATRHRTSDLQREPDRALDDLRRGRGDRALLVSTAPTAAAVDRPGLHEAEGVEA